MKLLVGHQDQQLRQSCSEKQHPEQRYGGCHLMEQMGHQQQPRHRGSAERREKNELRQPTRGGHQQALSWTHQGLP